MINGRYSVPSGDRNPWWSLFIIILFTGIGLFAGNLLGILIAQQFSGFSIADLLNLISGNSFNDDLKIPLLLYQGITSLFGFIVLPYIYIIAIEKNSIGNYLNKKALSPIPILLTILIVVSFMGVNSLIIEWNSEFNFPDIIENFAREKENEAKYLTEYLTDFSSPYEFLLGFFVIALIAGVGEELLFRGLLQNNLVQITRNVHFGIWLAAFIFGFFHLQFYGIVPRVLLGALFGYLYLWSGNLLIPIIAHITNNGFTLFMIYLHDQELIKYDIEKDVDIPILTAAFFLVLTVFMIIGFKKKVSPKNE
jgi:membrane protease YdiL (CAAX protease family)